MRKTEKRVLIKRVDTMTPQEIETMREQAISQSKARAAEIFGGSPDDYIVKDKNDKGGNEWNTQ